MLRRKKRQPDAVSYEPVRRLSFWRVLLALLLVSGLAAGGYFGLQRYKSDQVTTSYKPWYAAYVDVTATPSFTFEQLGATTHKDAVLAFIVALKSDSCTPSWGSAYTLDQARVVLDLERRIARLQQQGGDVAVSFGGKINQELAVACTDPNKLLAAYRSVVDRYSLDTIDLDLEEQGLTDKAAGERRAEAIAALQTERRSAGKKLAVWVTLPVAPQGLSEDGTDAISQLLAKGVDLSGVNIMTMDYGQSKAENQSMFDASQLAVVEAERQLSIIYQRAGIHLSDASVWRKIGVTPMIGQNDFVDEVFTLDDAKSLNELALSRGVGRMSMWSANRDVTCGSNYIDLKVVSDSCSGVDQGGLRFADVLGAGFDGNISQSAGSVTKDDPTAKAALKPDDPATSPYQIWSPTGAYLAGTKVVWHHNVYEAKWWTQGDTPDNPVLQAWQTPWQLVGPVLPGEKPIPQLTLPAGTYPDWSGTAAYGAGQRVLFSGVPYQAKWWNQGESPAAASSNPDSSPWVPLTQAQVNDIIAQQNTSKVKPAE